ncbi:hypothetical protein DCS32_07710 [Dokdonia sp. Dokd-P16]|uniref:hypothetical protein n=1 Tax=Dokdonia sp. Dokd-P16 TaxID=2173169 RepID=UPI000D545A10|nr:hypothetical protein [Dokdonia sp. Dokd-P16]AWH74047.1 hypothetical protein DCS32_07710 [Dokdonia sp. Dokd-P16]
MIQKLRFLLLVVALSVLNSCGFSSETETPIIELSDANEPFVGKIVLENIENNTKTEVTFHVDENSIRREQTHQGGEGLLGDKAGIIVNYDKDEVILYNTYGGAKWTAYTIEEYKNALANDTFPYASIVTSYDYTYSFLDDYTTIADKENALAIESLQLDYKLYGDLDIRQENFDTDEIKVRREMIALVFPNMPENVHFPLLFKISKNTGDASINDETNLSEKGWKNKINQVFNELSTKENKVKSIQRGEVNPSLFKFEDTDFIKTRPEYFFQTYSGGSSWGDD